MKLHPTGSKFKATCYQSHLDQATPPFYNESMTHDHKDEVFPAQRRALIIALVINFLFLVVEFVGGLLTNSMALIADAGHMLTDVMALGVALFALNISRKPPTLQKTYGFRRAEIIAAFINGLTLWLIVLVIIYESFERFLHPPDVKTTEMLIIAILGLAANVGSSIAVLRHAHENLNIKGAFLHLVADALGSVGVIAGAIIILLTGWMVVDPIISVLICVLIVAGSIDIIKESLNILMQGTPPELDLSALKADLQELEGVRDVHDMHAWALSRGLNALSAHVVVEKEVNHEILLSQIVKLVTSKYPVHHVTIQMETTNIQPLICTDCGAPV